MNIFTVLCSATGFAQHNVDLMLFLIPIGIAFIVFSPRFRKWADEHGRNETLPLIGLTVSLAIVVLFNNNVWQNLYYVGIVIAAYILSSACIKILWPGLLQVKKMTRFFTGSVSVLFTLASLSWVYTSGNLTHPLVLGPLILHKMIFIIWALGIYRYARYSLKKENEVPQ